MRTLLLSLLVLATLLVVPALAGNLTYDNGQTGWHPVQCVKPLMPSSIVDAHPETQGEDMNALITRHNAFTDAAQTYMNCISSEADHDQNMVNQAIAASAQKMIMEMQEEVNASAQPLQRGRIK